MTAWNPAHYESFFRERLQPGLDLINRITDIDPVSIVDLGCGTGHLTHRLANRFVNAQTVGIDRSAEMLAQTPPGPAMFTSGEIETWDPPALVDIVFANASLHWIPDHAALFPLLMGKVAPAGLLAVQMPLSWELPSHRAIRAIAAEYGVQVEEPPTLAPAEYLDVLAPTAVEVEVWTTTYLHLLTGDNPVFHWVSATGIKRFLARINQDNHSEFLARSAEAIAGRYPPRSDGRTVYPFERLFILARR